MEGKLDLLTVPLSALDDQPTYALYRIVFECPASQWDESR